jgi:hypothetical protein
LRSQAEFLPVLPLDTPVRWRGSCATLTAMSPQQLGMSAEGEGHRNSRSPAMGDACGAFICGAFRLLFDQLTVFSGVGISEKFLPSKSFAWGREGTIMA